MDVQVKKHEIARVNMRMPKKMKDLLYALGCYTGRDMTAVTFQALEEFFLRHGIVWQEWNGDISQFKQ